MSDERRRCIAVTGADGSIGWHLRSFWHGVDDVEVVSIDRRRFGDAPALAADLARADAVVHLAGMNRGNAEELESTNLRLAGKLLDACARTGSRPSLVFASSTHRDRDTPYGRSKRKCAELFQRWSEDTGARFVEWILPNVFGEHGRPFHNSAVSTFCHQLARGERPTLVVDQEIEWLHAQAVAEMADSLVRQLGTTDDGRTDPIRVRAEGSPLWVSEILARLSSMDSDYRAGIVPSTLDPMDRDLFNTYRSYLHPGFFPRRPQLHTDPRGSLFESVRTRGGGQCFLSTTVPGARRGGHYHRRKFERFLVVEGTARIRVRKLMAETFETFEIDGAEPAWVDMPTLHTHDVENIGSGPLTLLFWADELFDPERPDTFPEPVDPKRPATPEREVRP